MNPIHYQKRANDLTRRFASILITVSILFATLPLNISAAESKDVPNVNATAGADTAKKQTGLWYKTKILPAERKAAADKFKQTYYATREGKVPPGMDPGGVPHYFGPYPN